jgi:predicted HAD superfamily Cof-like phosphohydrolase
MNRHFEQVKKFHTAAGIEMPKVPTALKGGELEVDIAFYEELDNLATRMKQVRNNPLLTRVGYVLEEMAEVINANHIEDQVDGLGDAMIYLLGTFTLMGVKPERIIDIIAASNLGKIYPDGTVKRDEFGKITKPDYWEDTYAPEPLIIKELERQTRTANCKICNGEIINDNWVFCACIE